MNKFKLLVKLKASLSDEEYDYVKACIDTTNILSQAVCQALVTEGKFTTTLKGEDLVKVFEKIKNAHL